MSSNGTNASGSYVGLVNNAEVSISTANALPGSTRHFTNLFGLSGLRFVLRTQPNQQTSSQHESRPPINHPGGVQTNTETTWSNEQSGFVGDGLTADILLPGPWTTGFEAGSLRDLSDTELARICDHPIVSQTLRRAVQSLQEGRAIARVTYRTSREELVLFAFREDLTGTGSNVEYDAPEDMRLDIENMSHEELLALGEDIGDVDNGLSEEAISAHLKRRKCRVARKRQGKNKENCCICLEGYSKGRYLGHIDCRHRFHYKCIKEWLMRKNNCPICKRTALAI